MVQITSWLELCRPLAFHMQPYVHLIHAGKLDLVPESRTRCPHLWVMSKSVNIWCYHLEVGLGGWLSISMAAVLATLPALYRVVLRSPGFQLLSMLVGTITKSSTALVLGVPSVQWAHFVT